MQSSFSVIKNVSVVNQGCVDINTASVSTKNEIINETVSKEYFDSYENLARSMLQKARKQGEEIIENAYREASKIEENAYNEAFEKGYSEGVLVGNKEGYEVAYKEAYEINIKKATEEAEALIEIATENLKYTEAECKRYIEKNENLIKSTIFNIVGSVLHKEIEEQDGMSAIIYDAISNLKNTRNLIIRVNPLYLDDLKVKTDEWKEKLPFRGEIYLIADELMDMGIVIIEQDSGKLKISINEVLDKISEIIFEGK